MTSDVTWHVLAVVALVADVRALGAAAERVEQTARATLEDVLVDVHVARPREAARVVDDGDVERRVVGARARRVEHAHHHVIGAGGSTGGGARCRCGARW